VLRERLLPPPIPLNVIVTAVAVDDVAKRNHLSYVVAAVGAGVPHDPAAPSLTASFILYAMGVQLAVGVIVVATAAQVSTPVTCAKTTLDIKTKRSESKIRMGDRNLIVWILACFKDWTIYFLLAVKIA